MNTRKNAIDEAGSPCEVPIMPEYIEVPTANGRVREYVSKGESEGKE